MDMLEAHSVRGQRSDLGQASEVRGGFEFRVRMQTLEESAIPASTPGQLENPYYSSAR